MSTNQVQGICERCRTMVRPGEGKTEKINGRWQTTHTAPCPDNTSLPQNHKERFEQDFIRIFG